MRLANFLNRWLPVVFWCGLLFYLSSVPGLKTAPDPFWDEIIRSASHVFFYAVLYFLFFRAINYQKKAKNYLGPLAFSVLYGVFDEIHQSFVPTRTFQIKDLVLNVTGVALGWLGLKWWPRVPLPFKKWGESLGIA